MSDLGNKKIMSENLQRYMKIHKKTRSDLSNALNIPYTTISDWVNGNKYPRIDKIEMLANYFNIEKSDLVEAYKPGENVSSSFTTAKDAIEFILRVPLVANFGGYDLDKMTDDEIIEFANDVAEMIKMLGKKHR